MTMIILHLMIFLPISLFAANAMANGKPVNGQNSGRVIVMGIDDTGSYGLWNQAKDIATQIILQLQPGDIFYFRKIIASSYIDESSFFRLEIPKLKEKLSNNPFDRESKRVRKMHNLQNLALKRETIKRISKLERVGAGRTDIFGFLAAASEKFGLQDQDYKRILIIASDLQDNVQWTPDLNLSGSKVAVAGFQPMENPKEAQNFQKKWQDTFKKYGATKTIFSRADEKFNLNQF